MVNWTRGHFELIADTVNEEIDDSEERHDLCEAFRSEFRQRNRRFKSKKFMDRCWNGNEKENREKCR